MHTMPQREVVLDVPRQLSTNDPGAIIKATMDAFLQTQEVRDRREEEKREDREVVAKFKAEVKMIKLTLDSAAKFVTEIIAFEDVMFRGRVGNFKNVWDIWYEHLPLNRRRVIETWLASEESAKGLRGSPEFVESGNILHQRAIVMYNTTRKDQGRDQGYYDLYYASIRHIGLTLDVRDDFAKNMAKKRWDAVVLKRSKGNESSWMDIDVFISELNEAYLWMLRAHEFAKDSPEKVAKCLSDVEKKLNRGSNVYYHVLNSPHPRATIFDYIARLEEYKRFLETPPNHWGSGNDVKLDNFAGAVGDGSSTTKREGRRARPQSRKTDNSVSVAGEGCGSNGCSTCPPEKCAGCGEPDPMAAFDEATLRCLETVLTLSDTQLASYGLSKAVGAVETRSSTSL